MTFKALPKLTPVLPDPILEWYVREYLYPEHRLTREFGIDLTHVKKLSKEDN